MRNHRIESAGIALALVLGIVTLSPGGASAEYTVDVSGSFLADVLSLEFTIGTTEPATWLVYLVLTTPSVQVIPLWTVPLPVIAPPVSLPVALPFPALGVGYAGIWTGLFTAAGAEATTLQWIYIGYVGYTGPDGDALRQYLPPESLRTLTENPDPEIWIVDVRPTGDYVAGHLPTAVSYPSYEIEARLGEIPLDVNLILYCETGGRVQNVIEGVLEPHGYTRFLNWGGYTRWPYPYETGSD